MLAVPAESAPVIELKGLTKRFGSVSANSGINLKIFPGTIHGIIGENGAGKSTAMKLLYGMYRPDAGEIFINGIEKIWRSPSDAITAGIGMVHQHFMLAEPYSALDNVLLGDEPVTKKTKWLPRSLQFIDRKAGLQDLQKLSKQYGFNVDWNASIETLSVGIQQRIEILKLLYRKAEFLILDEPTAVLTPQEILELFVNLRRLKAEGKTILLITHKLREVMSITDRVTVFRAGKVVDEIETANTDQQALANKMVGRDVSLQVKNIPVSKPGKPLLEFKETVLLRNNTKKTQPLSFCVRSGEIVGIAGVEGNGQSDLLHSILNPSKTAQFGSIELLGNSIREWNNKKIRSLSLGYIPEDRHAEGLLLDRPIWENFLLGNQFGNSFFRRGFLKTKTARVRARAAIEKYDIRPRSISINAGGLSGGNQQKLIIAREFEKNPAFLVAAQPTRGVDVGAIEFIHQQILAARTNGVGVLLVSSELDEILNLSDRILVLFDGAIVAEYARGEVDEKKIGFSMGGGHAQ